jgi:signal transduction histidine kinase
MTTRSLSTAPRGLGIEYWLLIANAFVVLVPAFGIVFLRLWDRHLVRVTEERLIAESAVLADAWRLELAREQSGSTPMRFEPATAEPRLARSYTIDPAKSTAVGFAEPSDSPELRAALRVAPLVRGIERRRSSEVELLDAAGCVLSATDQPPRACLHHLSEVVGARGGVYAAAARDPAGLDSFALADLKRYRSVRVFAALPVQVDGRLAGIVRMSTRSSGPLEAALDHRRTVLLAGVGCVLFMLAVTHLLSRAISRPVRAVTAAAEGVVRGEAPSAIAVEGAAPSELRSLAGAVARMAEQLTDRAKYVADFATTVSHELKTPITGIRGAVELLRDEWDGMSAEQRERFLSNVDADAERMERLVGRLLELARIQSAAEASRTIDVRRFFADLCERYGERVQLSVDHPPSMLMMNPDHLETAVRNLIDNGVRHGRGLPVEVSVGGSAGRMVVAVRDRGQGISEGNRSRIFDRFFTTERDRGGTGLGLAIVQAVAETRGGSVTFETSSRGSTFFLTV